MEAKFGIQLLHYFGFQSADDSNLILPIDTDLSIIFARKAEVETALTRLNQEKMSHSIAKSKEQHKTSAVQTQAISLAVQEKKRTQQDQAKQDRVMLQSLKQQQGVIRNLKKEVQHLKEKRQEGNPINWSVKPLEKAEPAQGKIKDSSTPPFVHVLGEKFIETRLIRPAEAGASLLEIESNKGLKSGMIIVYGSGDRMEVNRIKGLGSIITEHPISHRLSYGSTIYIYTNKNNIQQKAQKLVVQFFIETLVRTEIVDAAISIAVKSRRKYNSERRESNLFNLQRNSIFSDQFLRCSYQHVLAFHSHSFSLDIGPHGSTERNIHTANMLSFVDIFLKLINYSTTQGSLQLEDTLKKIRSDTEIYSFFDAARSIYECGSIEDLIVMFASLLGEVIVNWNLFLALWTGRYAKSRYDYYRSFISSQNLQIEQYRLLLLYDIALIEEDGTVMNREKVSQCFMMLDENRPSDLDLADSEVDFGQFLNLRYQYSLRNSLNLKNDGKPSTNYPKILTVAPPTRSTSPPKTNIIHVFTNNSLGLVYFLDDEGCLTHSDLNSGDSILAKRVFFLEGTCHEFSEGFDIFDSFLQSVNLDTLNTESTKSFQLFHRLFREYSLPVTLVSFDSRSGLIACNCSLLGNSIAFYDPITLTRLHRVKSPIPINSKGRDLLAALNRGAPINLSDYTAARDGLISFFSISLERSIIITKTYAGSDIQIVDLATGSILRLIKLVLELPMSSFLYFDEVGLLATGFESGAVTVWDVQHLLRKRKNNFDAESNFAEAAIIGSSKRSDVDTTIIDKFVSVTRSENPSNYRWKRGKIIRTVKLPHENPAKQQVVDVLFGNGQMRRIDNIQLLRHSDEPKKVPHGPPLWSDPHAEIEVGVEVAFYDFCFSGFINDITTNHSKRNFFSQKCSRQTLCSQIYEMNFVSRNFTLNQIAAIVDSVLIDENKRLSIIEFFYLCFHEQQVTSDLPSMICCSHHSIIHIEFFKPDIIITCDSANFIAIAKMPIKIEDSNELQVLYYGPLVGIHPSILFGESLSKIPIITSNEAATLQGRLFVQLDLDQAKDAIRADLTNKDLLYRGFLFELDNGKVLTMEANGFSTDIIDFIRLQSVADILQHSPKETTPMKVLFKHRFHIKSVKYVLYKEQVVGPPTISPNNIEVARSTFSRTAGKLLSQNDLKSKSLIFDIADTFVEKNFKRIKKAITPSLLKRNKFMLQRNLISGFCYTPQNLPVLRQQSLSRNIFLLTNVRDSLNLYHESRINYDMFISLRNRQTFLLKQSIYEERSSLKLLTLQEFETSKSLKDLVILRAQSGIHVMMYRFVASVLRYYHLFAKLNHSLFNLVIILLFHGKIPVDEKQVHQLLHHLSLALFSNSQAFNFDLSIFSHLGTNLSIQKLFSVLEDDDVSAFTDTERLIPEKLISVGFESWFDESDFRVLLKQRLIHEVRDRKYCYASILNSVAEVLLKQLNVEKLSRISTGIQPLEILAVKELQSTRINSSLLEMGGGDQFDVVSEFGLTSYFPAIGMSICTCRKVAEKIGTEDYYFMVWRQTDDLNLTAWKTSLHRYKEKLKISTLSSLLIPISVSFRGEASLPLLVFRWSPSYVSFTQLVHDLLSGSSQSSGTLHETVNYNNLIKTTIQYLLDIRKEFGAINCLSTDSLYFNTATGEIKILLLPTLIEQDFHLKSSYIQFNKSHPSRACFIDGVKEKCIDWSDWIIRMFVLVFSIGFPPFIYYGEKASDKELLDTRSMDQSIHRLIYATLSFSTLSHGIHNRKQVTLVDALLQSLKFFILSQAKFDHQIQMTMPQASAFFSASQVARSFSTSKMILLPLSLQINSFLRKKKILPSSFQNKDVQTAINIVQSIIGSDLDRKVVEMFLKLVLSAITHEKHASNEFKASSILEELMVLSSVAQLVSISDILDPLSELNNFIDQFQFPISLYTKNSATVNKFESSLEYPGTLKKLRKLKDFHEVYFQLSYIENFIPVNINVGYSSLEAMTTANRSATTGFGGIIKINSISGLDRIRHDISNHLSTLKQQAIMIYSLPFMKLHYQSSPFHESKLMNLTTEFEQLLYFLDSNAEKISQIVDSEYKMVSISRCDSKHQLLFLYDLALAAVLSYMSGRASINVAEGIPSSSLSIVIESLHRTSFMNNSSLFKVLEDYLVRLTTQKSSARQGKNSASSTQPNLYHLILSHHRLVYEYLPISDSLHPQTDYFESEYIIIFLKIINEMSGIRIYHNNLAKKKLNIVKSMIALVYNHQYKHNILTVQSNFYLNSYKLSHLPLQYYDCMKAFHDSNSAMKLCQLFSPAYYDQDILSSIIEFTQKLFESFASLDERSPDNRVIVELSLQFTSFSWIGGWIKVLKRHVLQNHTTLISSILQIFALFARRKIWTRCWKALNVLGTLQMILKKLKNPQYYESIIMNEIIGHYNHESSLQPRLKRFHQSSGLTGLENPDEYSNSNKPSQQFYQFTVLLDQFFSLQKVGTLLENQNLLHTTMNVLTLWEDHIKYGLQYAIAASEASLSLSPNHLTGHITTLPQSYPADNVTIFCQQLIPLLYSLLSKELLDFHYLFDDSHSATTSHNAASSSMDRLEKLYEMIAGKYQILDKSIQILHLTSLEEYDKMIINIFPLQRKHLTSNKNLESMTQFLDSSNRILQSSLNYQEYQSDSVNMLDYIFSTTIKVSRYLKMNILRLMLMNQYLRILSKLLILQMNRYQSSLSTTHKEKDQALRNVLDDDDETIKEKVLLLYEMFVRGLYSLMFNLQKSLMVHSSVSLQTIEIQHLLCSIQFYWKILMQHSTFFMFEESFIKQQMISILDQWFFIFPSGDGDVASTSILNNASHNTMTNNESLVKHEYRTVLIQEALKICFKVILFNPMNELSSSSSALSTVSQGKSFIQLGLLSYLQQDQIIPQMKDIYFSSTINHHSFLKTVFSYFFTLLCNLPEYSFSKQFEVTQLLSLYYYVDHAHLCFIESLHHERTLGVCSTTEYISVL